MIDRLSKSSFVSPFLTLHFALGIVMLKYNLLAHGPLGDAPRCTSAEFRLLLFSSCS
jgi:hypothetical protein